jgi:hypothetical protein
MKDALARIATGEGVLTGVTVAAKGFSLGFLDQFFERPPCKLGDGGICKCGLAPRIQASNPLACGIQNVLITPLKRL